MSEKQPATNPLRGHLATLAVGAAAGAIAGVGAVLAVGLLAGKGAVAALAAKPEDWVAQAQTLCGIEPG